MVSDLIIYFCEFHRSQLLSERNHVLISESSEWFEWTDSPGLLPPAVCVFALVRHVKNFLYFLEDKHTHTHTSTFFSMNVSIITVRFAPEYLNTRAVGGLLPVTLGQSRTLVLGGLYVVIEVLI